MRLLLAALLLALAAPFAASPVSAEICPPGVEVCIQATPYPMDPGDHATFGVDKNTQHYTWQWIASGNHEAELAIYDNNNPSPLRYLDIVCADRQSGTKLKEVATTSNGFTTIKVDCVYSS